MSDQSLIRAPFFLRFAPLNPAFRGTPQQFLDALVELAEIVGPEGFYGIVISDTEPETNQGLWLRDGNKPYAWSDDSGGYEPLDLTDSLTAVLDALAALVAKFDAGRLILSETAPVGDDAQPNCVWGRLDASGYLDAWYNFVPVLGWKLRQVLPSVVTGDATGDGTNWVLTPEPVVTAYLPWRVYAFRVPQTNAGAAYLNVSALGPREVVLGPVGTLEAGMLVTNQIVVVIDDGTRLQLVSAPVRTFAETESWTDSMYVTAVVDREAVPAAGGHVEFTHGLGSVPVDYSISLVCVSADQEFVVGDVVDVLTCYATVSSNEKFFSVYADATVIGASRGVNMAEVSVTGRVTGVDSGVGSEIDTAKWLVTGFAMVVPS
jgi:hypothetical protein